MKIISQSLLVLTLLLVTSCRNNISIIPGVKTANLNHFTKISSLKNNQIQTYINLKKDTLKLIYEQTCLIKSIYYYADTARRIETTYGKRKLKEPSLTFLDTIFPNLPVKKRYLRVIKEELYVNDTLIQENQFYRNHTKIFKTLNYSSGKLHGISYDAFKSTIAMNPDLQQIKAWYSYSNGKLEGSTYFFYKNGAKREEQYYINDSLIYLKLYTKSGKLLGELR